MHKKSIKKSIFYSKREERESKISNVSTTYLSLRSRSSSPRGGSTVDQPGPQYPQPPASRRHRSTWRSSPHYLPRRRKARLGSWAPGGRGARHHAVHRPLGGGGGRPLHGGGREGSRGRGANYGHRGGHTLALEGDTSRG